MMCHPVYLYLILLGLMSDGQNRALQLGYISGTAKLKVNPTQVRDVMGHPLLDKEQTSLQGDHSACGEPPVNFKTKVPFWPGLAWPSQAKAELTRGLPQAEWSPCI